MSLAVGESIGIITPLAKSLHAQIFNGKKITQQHMTLMKLIAHGVDYREEQLRTSRRVPEKLKTLSGPCRLRLLRGKYSVADQNHLHAYIKKKQPVEF